MALYLALAVSALLAGLLVYRYDLYEREPWYMLALAAGLGAIAMRGAGYLELWSLALVEGRLSTAALAALEEEVVRLGVIAAIAFFIPNQFDDPMDGIVYGSIVGLGMGLEESHHLLSLVAEPGARLLPVEVVRLLGHLVFGGILGHGLGMAALGMPGWRPALFRSFAAAFALHFFWDWLALEAANGPMSVAENVAAIAIMLAGILLYGVLVVLASDASRRLFAPGSARTVWGWPFTRLFEKSRE